MDHSTRFMIQVHDRETLVISVEEMKAVVFISTSSVEERQTQTLYGEAIMGTVHI